MFSSIMVCDNFGILCGFILGHFFDFYIIPKMVISIMVVFIISLFFFPETPIFLVKQNKTDVCIDI